MKCIQRIPTSDFAYVEFEQEYDNPQEAIAHNAELVKMYEEPGLPQNEWAQVRNKMFQTGQFDPNIEGLSKAQVYFVNQCKLAIRSNEKADEPTIV